ncbi:MAG: alginate export family protein [Gammaproteobacteria bacterium]|jgi:hypothetical protein
MQIKTYIIILVVSAFSGPAIAAPWRAGEVPGLTQWLRLEGTYRVRYETLSPQFRMTRTGSDQVFVMRTTVKAGIHHGDFSLVGEMIDSRAYLDDNGSIPSSGIVNPLELLQGYVGWRPRNLFAEGDRNDIRIGRLTMDIGSRRFVARNRYRNTVNAFTGIDWQWQGAAGRELRAFFTLPVNREPDTFAELRDNEVEFDEEDSDVKFWGLFFADAWGAHDRAEVFYFGLDEDDSSTRFTRNQDISTLGFRLFRTARVGHYDYEIETAFQFGESRSSPLPTNTADLDHFAHFHHVEVGYSFETPWSPRVVAQYDYASGDDDPNDGDYGRFSTLYGARRFDFGPTGIYGPFARANVSTPGLRVQAKPAANVSGFLAYRGYWLASDKDAWAAAGIVDRSGNTDSFIGQQIEMRLRYDVAPGNARLEGGVAHLFSGGFMDDAPNSVGQGDVTYVYTQIALTF